MSVYICPECGNLVSIPEGYLGDGEVPTCALEDEPVDMQPVIEAA